ncbi:helix-turn-helix transcriptional regulator [Methylobacterium soli]|uniref:AlpA family phage regulatory protein n=1 Tax=Methylobacterium soli TaxID=553447 RepID=A0A6L3SYQ0_9HYPH|nr:AlpA family phage regulatory protein [Methylobacterium soli]
MNDRLIRRAEAAAFLSVGTSTLDRMIADGRLPRPLKISTRIVGWRESTLQAVLNLREAQACAK